VSGEGTIITLIAAIATVLGFDVVWLFPVFMARIETRFTRGE
jgi:hypothetical protein